MKVTIIRHGKTYGNSIGRYNGTIDDPLCEEGIHEAKNAGSDESVTHVYVTPLSRTQQTARICFKNASQTIVKGLAEMCFGKFEGRTVQEMKDDAEYNAWLESSCTLPCPGGESTKSFTLRVSNAFKELINSCFENGEQNVTIVAHGGTIMGIMDTFARSEMTYFDYFCQNCTGYKIVIDEALWTAEHKFTSFEKIERLS